jgi:hypothetical protein
VVCQPEQVGDFLIVGRSRYYAGPAILLSGYLLSYGARFLGDRPAWRREERAPQTVLDLLLDEQQESGRPRRRQLLVSQPGDVFEPVVVGIGALEGFSRPQAAGALIRGVTIR